PRDSASLIVSRTASTAACASFLPRPAFSATWSTNSALVTFAPPVGRLIEMKLSRLLAPRRVRDGGPLRSVSHGTDGESVPSQQDGMRPDPPSGPREDPRRHP